MPELITKWAPTTVADPGGVDVEVGFQLYCCLHKATHAFQAAAVERIVYALGFMAPVAYAGMVGPNYPHPDCLLSVLELSTLRDHYGPGVDASVTLRTTGEEWTE